MPFHRSLIIVPTYNERENVDAVAKQFLEPLENSELLFVDDASPDGTGKRIEELAAENPRIHGLHRNGKQGLGTAYLQGFQWGLSRSFDYFIEMDADFSHHPKYLPALLGACQTQGADVAIGSRYIAGGGTENWGLLRKSISKAGGVYARRILGLKIRDLTSGFVCYQRRALEEIDLSDIESNGYSFQIEMKYRASRCGLKLVEVPITFEDRRVGQSKMNHAIVAEALWRVWQLRLKQ